jgi:hypothetical protein
MRYFLIALALFTAVPCYAADSIVYCPFCVSNADFATGINITADNPEQNVDFYVGMFNQGELYSFKVVTVTPAGWTGLISDLCVDDFRSPSLVLFMLSDQVITRFWVTQFVFSTGGFSHVVLNSESMR